MDLSSQLSSNSVDITALFSRMETFEERLKAATAQSTPSSTADFSKLANDFQEFRTLVWQVLSKLKSQAELLTLGQDRHETFLRRKVLLFHGIAETKDEKISEVVCNILCNKMQLRTSP
ncbi:hypothetical protein NE865_00261 [Phthorimaea operculella]|nr:hypothetical protein NE865_00261 [Phthorimaea operculella]